MSTRVYVPSTWEGLRNLVAADGIGPAPFFAHAVTDALRSEYAAADAASRSSLSLIHDDVDPRRVVVAVDVETLTPVEMEDPTVVEVGEVVPFRRVAAVLVDLEDAESDVRAAADRYAEAVEGDADAEALVEVALDHELAWYATQEIGDLLDG